MVAIGLLYVVLGSNMTRDKVEESGYTIIDTFSPGMFACGPDGESVGYGYICTDKVGAKWRVVACMEGATVWIQSEKPMGRAR